jgi:hypothetical protein
MYLSDSRNSHFASFSRSGSSKIFLGVIKKRKGKFKLMADVSEIAKIRHFDKISPDPIKIKILKHNQVKSRQIF